MPVFPTDYPNATELDGDDSLLVSVDGLVRAVPGAVARSFMAPSGLFDVADHSILAGTLLQAADATTGWTLAFPSFGGVVSVVTTDKTQGTGSVSGTLNMQTGVQSKLYHTFTTPAVIGTHTLVAFDVKYILDGPVVHPVRELECKVADDTVFTGNVQTVPFPNVGSDVWATVVIPTQGLSAIKSIGVHRTGDGVYPATSNYRTIVRIDNVRWIDETKLNQALAGSAAAVAWVPPDYTPDANQYPLFLPAQKGLIDPALGVYSKANNVIQLHDYLAHVPGAEAGLVEVGSAIARIINEAPAGSTIRATPGAIYRFDNDVEVLTDRALIDFTGATLFLTYATNSPFWIFAGAHDTHIMGGLWLGYYPLQANGSTMTTVTGSPTTSGLTKLLDALDEEAKIPAHTNWLVGSHFSRHMPQQLGEVDDGLGPRAYCKFTLHDSAQVTNDCQICVYDDTTLTLLNSRTVTLTASPTSYLISYVQSDLRQRLRFTVKKLTATANTITVTNFTPYGESEYNATYDIASCFVLSNCTGVTISDMTIEGFGGDAIQVSNANVHYLTVRNITSRGCRRQGMSFNQGDNMIVENCEIYEVGRSAIDFEPYDEPWFTSDVQVRNIIADNIVNYGLAMGNWARNYNYTIDGFVLGKSRFGIIYGGFINGTMRNCDCTVPIANDYDFAGQNMTIENCVSSGAFTCRDDTNTFDPGTGNVTFTPSNNVIRNLTFRYGATAFRRFIGAVGYRLESMSISATSVTDFDAGQVVPYGPLIPPDSYVNLHLGEYNRQLPNTFKGKVAYQPGSIWEPDGFDFCNDPIIKVSAMSGTSTRGNNLGRRGLAVAPSGTTLTVTFPAKEVGVLQLATTTTGSSASTGTLLPSTVYYWRVAPRGRISGPGVYRAQITRTTGVGHNAVSLEVKGMTDHTRDTFIRGFTLLRGTTNGGPYTSRFDVIPNRELTSLLGGYNFVSDLGNQLNISQSGYDSSYPEQIGSWTATVDETGWEPDTNYTVVVTPSWLTTWRVTNKTTGGFTIEFGTPAGAADTIDYKIERLPS